MNKVTKEKVFLALMVVLVLAVILFVLINGVWLAPLFNMREDIYEIVLEVIAVVDDYLDMKIEPDEVREILGDLNQKLDEIGGVNLLLGGDILLLTHHFQTRAVFVGLSRENINDEEVLERRNDLARHLNKPPREN